MRIELVLAIAILAAALSTGALLMKRYANGKQPTRREVNLIILFYTGIFCMLCYGLAFYQNVPCASPYP